jgi:tetrahydromethanopterin S-methyltransferase subunit G
MEPASNCPVVERRGPPPVTLTEDQLDEIANRAADRAVEKITTHVYQQVGKSVLNKLLWIIGALSTAAYLYFHNRLDGLK